MFPGVLLEIIVALVIVLWLIQQSPMDPAIARIIRVVVIVFAAIWLLYLVVGLLGSVPGYPVLRR
jgi:hypothetical protein